MLETIFIHEDLTNVLKVNLSYDIIGNWQDY